MANFRQHAMRKAMSRAINALVNNPQMIIARITSPSPNQWLTCQTWLA